MIVFSYQGYSITLRNPANSPEITIDLKSKIRYDMKGNSVGYHGDTPTYEQTLNLRFYKCENNERQNFISFIKIASGKGVRYIDPYGQNWSVRILGSAFRIIEETRDYYTTELQLKGSQIG